MAQVRAVIFDIDGTLVDSNDVHAHVWVEAMGEQGYRVAFETVRPLIGMGGDKVLPQTLGITKESEEGQRISQRRKEIFKQRYLPPESEINPHSPIRLPKRSPSQFYCSPVPSLPRWG